MRTPLLLFSQSLSKPAFSTCMDMSTVIRSPWQGLAGHRPHNRPRNASFKAVTCGYQSKGVLEHQMLTLSPMSAPPRMKATYTLFLRMNICMNIGHESKNPPKDAGTRPKRSVINCASEWDRVYGRGCLSFQLAYHWVQCL